MSDIPDSKQGVIKILALTLILSIVLVLAANPASALPIQQSQQGEPSQNPIQINFNTYSPESFGNQDIKPTMPIEEMIEDGGNTLHIKGNSWKKILLPYTVTPYTVLEFDFRSPVQAEVQGIGFDTDERMSSNYTHQLYGTQSWGIKNHLYQYTASAPGWRHYRIPIGEYYLGTMSYLVFVNDHDVSNPTGESYFSNISVYEKSNMPVQPPVNINFNDYDFSPYGSQAQTLAMTIEDNGDTLHTVGNGWQKMLLIYTVTQSTVIEFDFKSTSQGQIQGIGFDNDDEESGSSTFQLYGTDAWGLEPFSYSRYAPEWKHFRIPVGKYYTGEMRYLFFTSDDDVSNSTSENYFKNVMIHESEVSLPLSVNFDQYAFSPYWQGYTDTFGISTEDGGNTLHLSGNGWAQISMPIMIMSNTILEFDFKSFSLGEVHGIGFDDDLTESGRTFELYGIQAFGLQDFHDYAGAAPNWKHYIIPIGQYYSGQMLYLFFASDADAAPTAQSFYSNLQIYNGSPPPTSTPTLTPTSTLTYTPASTFTITPTNTPAPNYGGSGTCWESKASWEGYTISYSIDRDTIPSSKGWDDSIHGAADAWNDVVPSHFQLVYESNSENIISYGTTQDAAALAETLVPLFSWMKFRDTFTIFNSQLEEGWNTNNIPMEGFGENNGELSYNVQNVMTHEFGHWIALDDMWESDGNCSNVTMWHSTGLGDINQITLADPDIEGINWQYP